LGNSGIFIEDDEKELDYAVALVSKSFQSFSGGKVPTFVNSGASDTMFVSKGDFGEYKLMTPRSGDSMKAVDGNFEIIGEGSVTKHYLVDGKEKKLTYTRAIHTPTLNANLISVSAFDRTRLTVTFRGGCGVVQKKDGGVILTARLVKGMYVVDELENIPGAPSAHLGMVSLSKSIPLEQWHRHLMHCSPVTIAEMSKENLLDGLNISGNDLCGKCKDCIIGHQTCWPFDGNTEKDLDPLELVSFDLWGPSCVQSAGGRFTLCPSSMGERLTNMAHIFPINPTRLPSQHLTYSKLKLNHCRVAKLAKFILIGLMIRLCGEITVNNMGFFMNLLHLILLPKMDWLSGRSV